MPLVYKVVRQLCYCAACILLPITVAVSQVSVTTYHNDNARTGQNTKETILTPQNVNASAFGKLFSHTVDSYVYGQPLYLPGVAMPGKGTHNVVYVVTQHDSVYAFDADRTGGAATNPLWHVSFINPAVGIKTLNSSDTKCGDVPPEIGITSTPVINPATRTLYVVARTKENGVYFQRLHALDVATGAEKFGGPVVIKASVSGTGDASVDNQIDFDPLTENQRAGLLFQNNLVFIAWGSQCDIDPYHGWLMAYDGTTLQQRAVWMSTPNGSEGAIWQSGAAPAADSLGNTYFATGNGTFDLDIDGEDYGNTIVKLGPMKSGSLPVADYFTPYNQSDLSARDLDLGSGGPTVLPNGVSALYPHLLAQVGKSGTLYLINRDNMGHYNPLGNLQIVQNLPGAVSGQGSWMTPAWWNARLYVSGGGDYVKSFLFHATTGSFAKAPISQCTTKFMFPGSTPSISANGLTNGIVWALQEDAYGSKGSAVLHAFDAMDLANELYNSSQNAARDDAGPAVKFAVPTIANGKVFVGGEMQLSVYGLLPASGASHSPAGPATQESTRRSANSTMEPYEKSSGGTTE